jgi:hypothetical protein
VAARRPLAPGIEAAVREAEGLTVVLPRAEADSLGLSYDFVGAWITLEVHSALEAVGLTAAVSRALTEARISCNVLAGFHHDHLLVPVAEAARALEVLANFARSRQRQGPGQSRKGVRARTGPELQVARRTGRRSSP